VFLQEQVASLVNTLMACHPHYIRCIRPNGVKKPKTFDDALSRNQIQYLGLLENVRVRRAGYAYRQTYEKFLHRFKLLTNETWPKWTGSPKDGSVKIVNHMKIPAASFATGTTKIFIREPRSVSLSFIQTTLLTDHSCSRSKKLVHKSSTISCASFKTLGARAAAVRS
jgi:myosin-1